jgi:putative ABC transport system substrate-binding protein
MIPRSTVHCPILVAAIFAASVASAQQGPQASRAALVAQSGDVAAMTEDGEARWAALLKELRALGKIEGENIVIERWAATDQSNEGFAQLARTVAETEPNVIVAQGLRLISAFREATTTIPIVGIGTFPADIDLAHPGGNITGQNATSGVELHIKHLQLLQYAVPTAMQVGWIGPRDTWDGAIGVATQDAAANLGLPLIPYFVDTPISDDTIAKAIVDMPPGEVDALIVSPSTAMIPYHRLVAERVLAVGLPAVAQAREYAEAGLMMAYGANPADVFRRGGAYVDRILDGADPADMAIEVPTEFDLIVNLRTAEALGIVVPPEIMAFATEFIE